MSKFSRRTFLAAAAVAAGGAAIAADAPPILDTHQHLWDLHRFRLPWLDNAGLLNRDYGMADYLAATQGLGITRAVYMEVNVIPEQRQAEADWILGLCKKGDTPTTAAVIAGAPADDRFRQYITPFHDTPVKGIRDGLKAGSGENAAFLAGLHLLGELGMSFDIVCGAELLPAAADVVKACPDTRFILDHCGNADARWFLKSADSDAQAKRRRDAWRADIAKLAGNKNVVCKISGVVEGAGKSPLEPAIYAPVVRHCLDEFGPDRVMFASNWPVVLLGSTLAEWVKLLRQIVSADPHARRRKLFHDNAAKFYELPAR